MKILIAIFLLTLSLSIGAVTLPAYYAHPDLRMYSLNGQDLGLWDGPSKISGAFVIGSDGKPYVPGGGGQPLSLRIGKSDQTPGHDKGDVLVGVKRTDGSIVALPVEDLTTVANSGDVAGRAFRTPPMGECGKNPTSCAYDRSNINTLLKIGAATATHLDPTCAPPVTDADAEVMALLLDFHNHHCEAGRKSANATSTAEDMAALRKEWDNYVKSQPTKALRQKAKLAQAIDYTARTSSLEAEPLGSRDSVKNTEACRDPGTCPGSACELRIIAATSKNGASLAKGADLLDKIINSARNEDFYDIWKPGHTSPYLTACLLRQGIQAQLGRSQKDVELRNMITHFRLAVQQAALVMTKSPEEIFEARGAGIRDPHEALVKLTRYYHPPGMEGCEPENFDNYHRITGAAYTYKIDHGKIQDVRPLVNDWILPSNGSAAGRGEQVPFLLRERRKTRDYTQVNPSHYWTIPGEPNASPDPSVSDWYIEKNRIHHVITQNLCKPYGLPNYDARDRKGCETRYRFNPLPMTPFYRKIPKWAYNTDPQNLPEIVCKDLHPAQAPDKIVSFGGACDPDMVNVADGQL